MAKKADGLIIRTRTRCDAKLLTGTKVKFIATATIGFDHIDTEYCADNGISWHHAPGCNSGSVTQYLASTLINLAKNHRFGLKGKTLGIVGVGHVGSKVARLAKILGMVPLLNDPPRARTEGNAGFFSLETIQQTADIISLHVPLIMEGPDKTFHLVNGDFFRKLGKMPYLINTSRGAVADTLSVRKNLERGKISGYVADVWEKEPSPDTEILKMCDIATPHIAGYSVEGKANGTAACVCAASRHFYFGIEDWYPEHLPKPVNRLIQLDARGKGDEQMIADTILAAYDVMDDNNAFRSDPSRFEYLRNNYPVRREPGAYAVDINGITPDLREKIQALGFRL
jgi:erythronate-4-phosphate dehydrogenase